MLGSVLIALALALGATLTAALSGFPVPILAGLLTVAGLLHIALLKDLRRPAHWALALAVGITGFLSNLAVALRRGTSGLVGGPLDSGVASSPQMRRPSPFDVTSAPVVVPPHHAVAFACELIQRVVQHVGEHPKAVAHPAWRTRQVDHQGPSGHPA